MSTRLVSGHVSLNTHVRSPSTSCRHCPRRRRPLISPTPPPQLTSSAASTSTPSHRRPSIPSTREAASLSSSPPTRHPTVTVTTRTHHSLADRQTNLARAPSASESVSKPTDWHCSILLLSSILQFPIFGSSLGSLARWFLSLPLSRATDRPTDRRQRGREGRKEEVGLAVGDRSSARRKKRRK
jgi:hypothetical protein